MRRLVWLEPSAWRRRHMARHGRVKNSQATRIHVVRVHDGRTAISGAAKPMVASRPVVSSLSLFRLWLWFRSRFGCAGCR